MGTMAASRFDYLQREEIKVIAWGASGGCLPPLLWLALAVSVLWGWVYTRRSLDRIESRLGLEPLPVFHFTEEELKHKKAP